MEADNRRRLSITGRVWLIVAVGLASGTLSIAVLLWARHDIRLARRATETTTEDLLRLVDLHAAGTMRARAGLLTELELPAETSVHTTWSDMLSEANHGVAGLLAADASSSDLLEELDCATEDLFATRRKCVDWRARHDKATLAYDVSRSWLLDSLRDLRVMLESSEGKARLEAMSALRDAHSDSMDTTRELRRAAAEQALVNGIVRCKTELAELTLLCWTLLETEDADVLADLKDNGLASSLRRLTLELESARHEDIGAIMVVNEITSALFGTDYRPDPAHQTIVLGTGGAYAASLERIRSLREKETLIQSVSAQAEQMAQLRAQLLIAGQTVLKRTAAQAEVLVQTTIQRMLAVGVVAALAFAAMAVRTGRAVHRYVVALSDAQRAEEASREELESANMVLQSALEERSRLESQLVHAQKMESIGQLAAGIAHEINTPIQYVGDNTRFIRDSIADLMRLVQKYRERMNPESPSLAWDERAKELQSLSEELDIDFLADEMPAAIEQSLDGVARVTEIVRAMKEFSHPGDGVKTPEDVNRAIESTVTVCRNRWKYVAELRLDFDADLPMVPCLIGEFNQVILNLIVNAADAIGEARQGDDEPLGMITVCTRRNGDVAEVHICDTGGGIPDAIKSRIFDPFFTTKEVGNGTGQGLAICHDVIVAKHGGTLEVESERGVGSTFTIRLPIGVGSEGCESEAA